MDTQPIPCVREVTTLAPPLLRIQIRCGTPSGISTPGRGGDFPHAHGRCGQNTTGRLDHHLLLVTRHPHPEDDLEYDTLPYAPISFIQTHIGFNRRIPEVPATTEAPDEEPIAFEELIKAQALDHT